MTTRQEKCLHALCNRTTTAGSEWCRECTGWQVLQVAGRTTQDCGCVLRHRQAAATPASEGATKEMSG